MITEANNAAALRPSLGCSSLHACCALVIPHVNIWGGSQNFAKNRSPSVMPAAEQMSARGLVTSPENKTKKKAGESGKAGDKKVCFRGRGGTASSLFGPVRIIICAEKYHGRKCTSVSSLGKAFHHPPHAHRTVNVELHLYFCIGRALRPSMSRQPPLYTCNNLTHCCFFL